MTNFLDKYSLDQNKVDIWAAGVTIYKLLTDEYPFETKSKSSLLRSIFDTLAIKLTLLTDKNMKNMFYLSLWTKLQTFQITMALLKSLGDLMNQVADISKLAS